MHEHLSIFPINFTFFYNDTNLSETQSVHNTQWRFEHLLIVDMLQFHLQLFVYWAFCREQTELMPKVSAISTWDEQNGGRNGIDDDNNVFCQWRRRVCKQINIIRILNNMNATWKNTKHKFDTHKQNRNNLRNVDDDVYGKLTAFHLLQKSATIDRIGHFIFRNGSLISNFNEKLEIGSLWPLNEK